jgi:hypothetical protein
MAGATHGAATAQDEAGGPGRVGEPLAGCAPEGSLEERVGLGVGLAESDPKLEAGGSNQPLRRFDRGDPCTRLDPTDRRLGNTRPPGELRLGEACPLAGLANDVP